MIREDVFHGFAATPRAGLLLVAIWLCASVLAAQENIPPELVFFRASLEGNAEAFHGGKTVSPSAARNVRFEKSDPAGALVMSEKALVRYPLQEGFPCDQGSLEFRIQPSFPQNDESPERLLLRVEGENGWAIRVAFHPSMYGWDFAILSPNGIRCVSWQAAAEQGKWTHFLLSWDKKAEQRGEIALYRDGQRVGVESYEFALGELNELTMGGDSGLPVRLQELVIYKRALTGPQAGFLATPFNPKPDRFAALARRVPTDEHDANTARAARRERIARLTGKVGHLTDVKGCKPRDVLLAEDITAVLIPPEDVGRVDLKQFAVIYFPPGGQYPLTPEQEKLIVQWVRDGGGYVGSCQGAYTASRLGILDFECSNLRINGLVGVELKPHAVTEGYPSSIQVQHGSGPVLTPRKDCEAVGYFNLFDSQSQKTGAILTGHCGKGRVVLFGFHPLGGSVAAAGQIAIFSGKGLDTERLFVNALLHAAGLDGPNQTPPKK